MFSKSRFSIDTRWMIRDFSLDLKFQRMCNVFIIIIRFFLCLYDRLQLSIVYHLFALKDTANDIFVIGAVQYIFAKTVQYLQVSYCNCLFFIMFSIIIWLITSFDSLSLIESVITKSFFLQNYFMVNKINTIISE